jgi:hypothetical protein
MATKSAGRFIAQRHSISGARRRAAALNRASVAAMRFLISARSCSTDADQPGFELFRELGCDLQPGIVGVLKLEMHHKS